MKHLTWNGDPANPPIEGELFDFNGKVYYWEKCGCSNPFCKRPLAYTEDGNKVQHMTARLRGDNQGMPASNVLVKFFGLSTYADRLEAGADLHELWDEFLTFAEPDGEVDADFLTSKNIQLFEYVEAKADFGDSSSSLGGATIMPPMDLESFLRFLESGEL